MEHLDFLIVGAGLSGIGAAHHVQEKCEWADYAIFEACAAIGGTWDLFRYPGIRSDSDMFTLGYSFRPWDDDKSIADGASILQYIKDTATEAGIDKKIRYHHKIVSAEWSSVDARWTVTAERSDTGEQVMLTCTYFMSCSGYYRYDHGHQPDFPGQADFKGTIVHPQHWPEDLDYQGKRVVVIGSGATAITLVPSMAKEAEHVTMLQRSPTYVAALPEKNPIAMVMRRVLPKKIWGPAIRWWNATMTQGSYQLSRRHPSVMKKLLRLGVKANLPRGYDIDTHFTPRYNPWDQRLCLAPNGDIFKAIKRGQVTVATDHVDTFTTSGIRLESGEQLEADIIVTATGLELLYMGGIEVIVDDEKVDMPSRLLYRGTMLEGIPNLFSIFGYTNASWTLKCDLVCDYATRLANHMRRTGLAEVRPNNTDPTVEVDKMLDLTANYIARSRHLLPQQANKHPWRMHQNYYRDYRSLKLDSFTDDALVFSNPKAASTPVAAA